MRTTVTDNNHAIIPSEIANAFDIHPGTQLEWENQGESIVVRPLSDRGELGRQLMGAGRKWLMPGADPLGDLIRDREQDAVLDELDDRQ